MVQTITPVVHGGSRSRWSVSVLLHVLGATASAVAAGAVLGGLGALLGAPWGAGGMFLVAGISVVYAAREAFGLPIPLPELRRQVPEWWRGALGTRTSSFLYGVALGPGVGTHLRHGTYVAVGVTVVALGEPVLGMIAIGAFGLARALGISVVTSGTTSRAVGDVGERLERLGAGPLSRIANAAALLGIAVAAQTSTMPGAPPAPWLWSAALAATFGWAALAKIVDLAAWRRTLGAYALPGPLQQLAWLGVPLAETLTAVALLTDAYRIGATVALLLLGAFTVALVRTRRAGVGSLPCGCFGGRSSRSIPRMLGRNLALAVIAGGTFAFGAAIPLALPGLGEALPATLTVGGVLLAAWVLRRGVALWSRKELDAVGTPGVRR